MVARTTTLVSVVIMLLGTPLPLFAGHGSQMVANGGQEARLSSSNEHQDDISHDHKHSGVCGIPGITRLQQPACRRRARLDTLGVSSPPSAWVPTPSLAHRGGPTSSAQPQRYHSISIPTMAHSGPQESPLKTPTRAGNERNAYSFSHALTPALQNQLDHYLHTPTLAHHKQAEFYSSAPTMVHHPNIGTLPPPTITQHENSISPLTPPTFAHISAPAYHAHHHRRHDNLSASKMAPKDGPASLKNSAIANDDRHISPSSHIELQNYPLNPLTASKMSNTVQVNSNMEQKRQTDPKPPSRMKEHKGKGYTYSYFGTFLRPLLSRKRREEDTLEAAHAAVNEESPTTFANTDTGMTAAATTTTTTDSQEVETKSGVTNQPRSFLEVSTTTTKATDNTFPIEESTRAIQSFTQVEQELVASSTSRDNVTDKVTNVVGCSGSEKDNSTIDAVLVSCSPLDQSSPQPENKKPIWLKGLMSIHTFYKVRIIFRWVIIGIILPCFPLGLLSAAVFTDKRMTNSISYLVVVFNITESLKSVMFLIHRVFKQILGNDIITWSSSYSLFFSYFVTWLPDSLGRMSLVLNTLVTIDRFIKLTFPLRGMNWNIIKYPKVTIFISILVPLSVNMSNLILMIDFMKLVDSSKQFTQDEVLSTIASTSPRHFDLYSQVHIISSVCFRYIPLIVSIVLNSIAFLSIYRQQKESRLIRSTSQNSVNNKDVKRRRQNNTMIVGSMLLFSFLVSVKPIVRLLSIFHPTVGEGKRNFFIYFLLNEFALTLDGLTPAVNFLVYYNLSSLFRRSLHSMGERITGQSPTGETNKSKINSSVKENSRPVSN